MRPVAGVEVRIRKAGVRVIPERVNPPRKHEYCRNLLAKALLLFGNKTAFSILR